MATDRISAIVLAGGRSTRFGEDKLAVRIDERTVLEHAIEAVAIVADEVIVVGAAGESVAAAPRDPRAPTWDRLGRSDLRLVRDTVSGGGPLAGLRDGAAAASGERLLVVAGDMPTLRPEVLRLLLAALEADQATEAAMLSPAPAPAPAPAPPVHPLPMALRRVPALDAATQLLTADRRSLRGLLAALRTISIPAVTWLDLDSDAATLRDIDTRADLTALEADLAAEPRVEPDHRRSSDS